MNDTRTAEGTIYRACFSPTRTSFRTAAAISRGIAERSGMNTVALDATYYSALPPTQLSRHDLLIAAVPVYGSKAAPAALDRLAGLRGEGTPATAVVVYGNRDYGSAAGELHAFLTERGFTVTAMAAFVGEHSYSRPDAPIAQGRPDAEDLLSAERFGRAVWKKTAASGTTSAVDPGSLAPAPNDTSSIVRFSQFIADMKRPGAALPQKAPVTDPALCTQCGTCATLCPTGAIPPGNGTITDASLCIKCCACVKGCPARARSYFTPFSEVLSELFGERKPVLVSL